MSGRNTKAQVMLEFTFCMIVVLIMVYGLIMIFRWSGNDLAERRRAHDASLSDSRGVVKSYVKTDGSDGPLKQIDTYFYTPSKMNAVWTGEAEY